MFLAKEPAANPGFKGFLIVDRAQKKFGTSDRIIIFDSSVAEPAAPEYFSVQLYCSMCNLVLVLVFCSVTDSK